VFIDFVVDYTKVHGEGDSFIGDLENLEEKNTISSLSNDCSTLEASKNGERQI